MKHKKNAPGGGASERLREFINSATQPTTERPQRKPQRDRARDLLTRLCSEFPVFREYRPLAIGIREALRATFPDVELKIINRTLAMHCRCGRYLRSIVAGGPRYSLTGTPSGEISEEHRAAAVLLLERRAKAVKPPNPLVLPVPVLHVAKLRRPA